MPEPAGQRPGIRLAVIGFAALVALACGPSDPLERVRLMQDEAGDWAATVEPLRGLLAEQPDDPEVQYRYGLALIGTGENSLAIWPLRRALESPEWLEKAGPVLANTFLRSGAFDDAIEIATQVLEQEPENVRVLLLRAHARIRSRRFYEEALADADRALEIAPDERDALVPRAVALLALERVDEASEALAALEGHYRDDSLGLHGSPELCAARASFAKEKGESEVAAERYQGCLERFPAEPALVQDAIDFYDETQQPERSLQVLGKAIESAPANVAFRSLLVVRLREQGRGEQALRVLRWATEALDAPQDAAEAWASLGHYLLDEGEYDRAVDALRNARQIAPGDSPRLNFALADALVLADRYDEAIALAEEISVPAHRALVRGGVALARGDPTTALTHFDEGVRLWPNNAVARYYAAVAAEQLGNFERAIEDYRYAMRIDNLETDAYLRLARLQVALGRDEHGLAALGFRAGHRPGEEEAQRLRLRLLTRLGREGELWEPLLERLAGSDQLGAAVAALALGTRDRAGPEQAIAFVDAEPRVDLTRPQDSEALEVVVESLAEAGRVDAALQRVDAGLRKHPNAAIFHALRGVANERGGDDAGARKSYERALELDPGDARALAGLARIETAAGNREAALDFARRALAADPLDRASWRVEAALLIALERSEEGEQRLSALLREHPYDAEAARTLAELRLERGLGDRQTLALARRALRFGGGAEAEALVERVRAMLSPSAG